MEIKPNRELVFVETSTQTYSLSEESFGYNYGRLKSSASHASRENTLLRCGRIREFRQGLQRRFVDGRTDVITGRMPRSGKLPVLFLLTGQKSDFSPRRGDSLHRFTSNLAGLTGTWVRLAAQNFASIAPGGGNAAPKISKISTFW